MSAANSKCQIQFEKLSQTRKWAVKNSSRLMDRTNVNPLISMNEWIMTSKGKTWSLGTNSRLPFAINVILNLSIDKNTKKLACENSHLSLLRCKRCFTGVTSAPQQQKFPSGKEQGVMAVFAGYRKRSISWTRKDPFCSCGNSTGSSQ